VRRRAGTLDLIAAEFAAAVEAGRFEQAEGWLATATLVASRTADRTDRTGIHRRLARRLARVAARA
jgi:hypothetical protein